MLDGSPSSPRDGKFDEPAGEHVATRGQCHGIDRQAHGRESWNQLGEDHFQLDARQRSSDAIPYAVSERKVPGFLARDVNALRVGEYRGVVVGRSDVQQYQVSGVDGDAVDVEVCARV